MVEGVVEEGGGEEAAGGGDEGGGGAGGGFRGDEAGAVMEDAAAGESDVLGGIRVDVDVGEAVGWPGGAMVVALMAGAIRGEQGAGHGGAAAKGERPDHHAMVPDASTGTRVRQTWGFGSHCAMGQ